MSQSSAECLMKNVTNASSATSVTSQKPTYPQHHVRPVPLRLRPYGAIQIVYYY